MSAAPSQTSVSAAGPAGLTVRVARSPGELDAHAWSLLPSGDFYVAARWLRAVDGLLSRRSAFAVVADASGRPVAGFAAYLVDPGAYLFLDPPRLLVAAGLVASSAEFLEPPERDELSALVDRVGPGLSKTYPVAVCVSPFAFTVGAAGDFDTPGAADLLVEAFDHVARDWGASSSAWLYVERTGSALAQPLGRAGYLPATVAARCSLPIRWSSFDDYVTSFGGKRRGRVRTEVRRPAERGLRVRILEGAALAAAVGDLTPLFVNVSRKHGHDPASAAETLDWIVEHFVDVARAVVVEDGDEPVAFHLFYDLGDVLYAYLAGQRYDAVAKETFAYFHATFYEPIRLAISRGVRRIDYGTEAYEAKVTRGCELRPVAAFLRFADPDPDLARLLSLHDAGQRARFERYAGYRRPH